MNEQEEYEFLKQDLVSKCINYTGKLQSLSFQCLPDFALNLEMMQSYTEFITSHIAYRKFVYTFRSGQYK